MSISYHTPYQPETPISAREPEGRRPEGRYRSRGLMWESRVDTWYGMKTNIL